MGVPKEMHLFFPQTGNPLRQDPVVSIFWISPNSPISFSAHRWHSTHVKRLNQEVFPPCREQGSLFQVYIKCTPKVRGAVFLCITEDVKIHSICYEIALKCYKILMHRLCQSPFTKTVPNKVTFVFRINKCSPRAELCLGVSWCF